MTHYISINGVLRDFWTKLLVEYRKFYLETPPEAAEDFEYKIHEDVVTNNIMEKLTFQSEDEMNYFLYVDFPLELYGQSAPQYRGVMLDLQKYITQHKDDRVVLVSKEYSKSIPSTLFFLSKTSCTCNHISFYQSDDELQSLWQSCDLWITDDPVILAAKPEGKTSIKVAKDFNQEVSADQTINQLSELIEHEEQQPEAATDSSTGHTN